MKQLLKYSVRLLLAIGVVSLFFACEAGPNFKEYTYPAPTVTGMSATSGYANSYVNITGAGFDTLRGPIKVYFGGVKADSIISCKDAVIRVKVPAKAVSGKVTFKIWTNTFDSIGTFTVVPSPVVQSIASKNAQKNVAFPGDVLTITGTGFGTDASKISVSFNGTPATIVTPITDKSFDVTAPVGFKTGNVSVTINGLTIIAIPAIVNPDAAGEITPYFLSNFASPITNGTYDGNRWGTLGAPWVTNAGAKNKGGLYGGWAKDNWKWSKDGVINWETWGNTPVVDGKIYQPTSMPLPAGSYTVSFNYYSEIQTNASVYCVAAAGGNGIPSLPSLSTALGSVALFNGAVIGTTAPNMTEIKSFDFTLTSSQVVSIGFLGNLPGRNTQGNYFILQWIKVVKN